LLPLIACMGACTSPKKDSEPVAEVVDTIPTYICNVENTAMQYLFLGHTYQWYTTDRIDTRLEKLDLSCYDQVWLGGDMTAETTREPGTIAYLDSIFDLKNLETYWTVGNHDIRNGNVDWITDATGRPTYYAHYNKRGFTVIVFNTLLYQIYEDDSATMCVESQKQLELVQRVCDTISESSQLIILMHHVIWNRIDLNAWRYGNHGFPEWRVVCDTGAVFMEAIYPMLRDLQERGIQVFCIAGDGGLRDSPQSVKFGLHVTQHGVTLMASGINNSKYAPGAVSKPKMKDMILVLYHDTATRHMSFRAHDLDSLLSSQVQ